MARLFDDPTDMEPLLPEDQGGELAALGWEIIRRSERLSGTLHPVTAGKVADLVRVMNSYYSNFIEGHRTRPADLETALKKEFHGNREQRALQELHVAHLKTQSWVEAKLKNDIHDSITDADFFCSMHRELYAELPTEMKTVFDSKGNSYEVQAGGMRKFEVNVGIHLAPAHSVLPDFLGRFHQVYSPKIEPTGESLVAWAAAHHRFVWIHPFADGNGRVCRLFSHAWLIRSQASAQSLFTISRGLARNLDQYRMMLSGADEKRRSDFDGRGYLTRKGLNEFVLFFLETAIDQLEFMDGLLQLPGLIRRLEGFASLEESSGRLPKNSTAVLRDVFLRGEISRGDVARIIGRTDRTARKLIGQLLQEGYLFSPSPKGHLQIGFPSRAAAAYFPELYPV